MRKKTLLCFKYETNLNMVRRAISKEVEVVGCDGGEVRHGLLLVHGVLAGVVCTHPGRARTHAAAEVGAALRFHLPPIIPIPLVQEMMENFVSLH